VSLGKQAGAIADMTSAITDGTKAASWTRMRTVSHISAHLRNKDPFMKLIQGNSIGRWIQRLAQDDNERKLDEQLENSFPASDPPSYSRATVPHGTLHALKSAWSRSSWHG